MKNVSIKSDAPEEVISELGHLPPMLTKLLFHRGIFKKAEADSFLNPEYKPHDPFLMKDMKKAVDRILKAINLNEKIFIFSDYDADGIPGAVVLSDFFQKIEFSNFDVYIPNRDDEGFGLNDGAVNFMADSSAKLIITVDCGTGDNEQIDLANKLGVDVIVTDHHLVNSGLPNAYAVLNPKREDCPYPEKMLCGAGVAFKLVEALIVEMRNLNIDYVKEKVPIGWEKWLLDMVGLATLSDMVPLVGENRIFAKYGLSVMKKSLRPGLGALFAVCGIKRTKLTEDDIGFSLTPRINSASRMGDPKDAFKLLSTKNESEAVMLASKLDGLNKKRKTVVAVMSREIKTVIKERKLFEKNVIALGNPEWKPSLLGLVAGNIAEEFGRPVFLWGRDGQNYKGSCRGFGDVGVSTIMSLAKDLFKEFGGHEMAGGFSIFDDKIYQFSEFLEKAFEKAEMVNVEERNIEADMTLSMSEIDFDTLENLKRLAPFGEGNPKPVFMIRGVTSFSFRRFGADKKHLAVSLFGDEKSIDAVSFFFGDKDTDLIKNGSDPKILAHLEEDNFSNLSKMRLRIVDII